MRLLVLSLSLHFLLGGIVRASLTQEPKLGSEEVPSLGENLTAAAFELPGIIGQEVLGLVDVEIERDSLERTMAGETENTERNRLHFDQHAASYTNKWQKTIDQIIAEIRKRREWIGVDWIEEESDTEADEGGSSGNAGRKERTVRLLDYACGPGTVSRALASYTTSCLGMDLSTSMVAEYNKAASNQGLSESEMHAVVGNLLSEDGEKFGEGDEKWWDFDIAVVGMGFHHFDDPWLAAKRLVQRLKKGGVLMIIDFLPHGGPGELGDHSHAQGHSHGHGHSHDHSSHSHSHDHSHSHSHGKAKDVDIEKKGDQIPASQLSGAIRTVTHHGFSIKDVKRMFEDAGAGEGFEVVELGNAVVFSVVADEDKDGKGKGGEKEIENKDFKRSVFMARGVKL